MFARTKMTLLTILLGAPLAVAQPLTGGSLTAEEKALVDWAAEFQTRAQALCQQIAVPSRAQAAQQMAEAIRQHTADQQQHMDTSMDTLGTIAGHRRPALIQTKGWGPGLEREVTRRQAWLLQAWHRCQQEHSPRRVAAEALRQERNLTRRIDTWRVEALRDEAKLARLERAGREAILKRVTRQYAANWLLAGHPDAYLPPEWSELARKAAAGKLVRLEGKVVSKPADEELKSMDRSIKHLQRVLIAVGLGDFSPDHLMQVERELRQSRHQLQAVMAARTGRQVGGAELRLAAAPDRSRGQTPR